MKDYDLIVFDWDGTLYDSAAMIVYSVQLIARELGMPVPSEALSRSVIGLSFDVSINQLFPHSTAEEKEKYIKAYRHWQEHRMEEKPQLFQGAREVLNELKKQGYLLAVATGKIRKNLDRDLIDFDLVNMFDTTRCGDEGQSKPHPEMLLIILDKLGIDPKRTLMVGDTEYDMLLALGAGTHSAAATYGVHSQAALLKHKPRYVIHDINELLKVLGEKK